MHNYISAELHHAYSIVIIVCTIQYLFIFSVLKMTGTLLFFASYIST